MRWLCVFSLLLARLVGTAAVVVFDFGEDSTGATPPGFIGLLAGEGRPGVWSVVQAEVAPAMMRLSEDAPQTSVRPVLTQTDHDPTDERFPMLVYEKEEFGDFTLTTRLRILGGEKEQMAGMAFRVQDAQNFYVIRLSALGRNLRFYKVVGGFRGNLIGPAMSIATNEWYELTIQCQGNEILCKLNGTLVMPPLQDSSFSKGKIAFWTKSDSECQFDGARLSYIPTVPLSQQILATALEKYGRVLDLRIYTPTEDGKAARVVASKNPEDSGALGGEAEVGTLRTGDTYVGKSKGTVTVVMPLRDRNGDPVAAVRVVMDSFAGQTENNAIVRARPIIKLMEKMVQPSQDTFK